MVRATGNLRSSVKVTLQMFTEKRPDPDLFNV